MSDTIIEQYLTTNEVAQWIRVSASTLCRWRQDGRGPRRCCETLQSCSARVPHVQLYQPVGIVAA